MHTNHSATTLLAALIKLSKVAQPTQNRWEVGPGGSPHARWALRSLHLADLCGPFPMLPGL